MLKFLEMGGYAFYVWMSYGITLFALIGFAYISVKKT